MLFTLVWVYVGMCGGRGGIGIEEKWRKVALILSDSSTIVKHNTNQYTYKIVSSNSLIYVAYFASLRFSSFVQFYALLFSINSISLTFYQLGEWRLG